MIPGMIGFAVAYTVESRLKHHIDREKLLKIENPSELYRTGYPPTEILTERGLILNRWCLIGASIFMLGIVGSIYISFK